MTLIVDTYEGNDRHPILSHTFRATSLVECYRIMGLHAKYDSFLRAALTTGDFHGIKVRNVYRSRA